ncbi:MAG: panE [Glaciihabitans sp.]|nr:panE [Glaciihabitans sp.]
MAAPRILIVGAGAVGGFFGARLATAGRDVTFLVRPQRAAQLAGGLTVQTPTETFTTAIATVTADDLPAMAAAAPFDVVVLTVKAYGLEAALADIAPAVGPRTLVLPLLNGMRHLDVLRERFGADRVLGGLCVVVAQLQNDGSVRKMMPQASITFGAPQFAEPTEEFTAALDRVDVALAGAGFRSTRADNIEAEMWKKWVMLASGGALGCLLGGTVGDIAAVPGGTTTARAIVSEAAAIATAAGYPPPEAHLASTTAMLSEADSSFTTSMYRDFIAGSATEADQILGDLVGRAAQLGVSVPLLAAAYVRLSVAERRRN